MSRFADKYQIESVRLRNWDYSTPGIYFITICTYNHINLLGKFINHQIELKPVGVICQTCITEIPHHFPAIRLMEFVVMPNHIHLLFHVETPDLASLQDNRKITLINLWS